MRRFWALTGSCPDEAHANQSAFEVLSLRVNRELQILICLTCQRALDPTPSRVINHFNDKHCAKGETVEKQHPGLPGRLEKDLRDIPLATPKMVRIQPHDRAPISGIQVETGFYCPMSLSKDQPCLYVAGRTTTMETHMKTKHPGDASRPRGKDLVAYPCDYQTLFTGNLKFYFRVRTGLTGLEAHPDGPRNPYSVFVRTASKISPSEFRPEPIKDNELPSLLRATGWTVFLEPYRENPKDVVALVEFPTPRLSKMAGDHGSIERVLCKLPEVSQTWMDNAYLKWKSSSLYVRRILARYPM